MSEDRSNPLMGLLDRMPQGRLGPQGQMRDHLQSLVDKIPRRNGPDELGLKREHDVSHAIYNRTKEARNMLDHIREELDKLSEMADTVTPQDVMGAAGRLVGHGVPAREMATLLSDMPLGAGQGLASWIQMHDASVRQQEMEVDRVSDIARHRLGMAAFRELAGEHVMTHVRAIRAMAQQAAGPMAPQPRQTSVTQVPQTSVMQVAQRPEMQGPGAEEAA